MIHVKVQNKVGLQLKDIDAKETDSIRFSYIIHKKEATGQTDNLLRE